MGRLLEQWEREPPGGIQSTMSLTVWAIRYLISNYWLIDQIQTLQVLKIRGPACHFSLCADVYFQVLDTDGAEMALISKKWMGCFKEALTDADNFVIDFNEGLPLETKVLIFASTFLIDMMYFEMNNWWPSGYISPFMFSNFYLFCCALNTYICFQMCTLWHLCSRILKSNSNFIIYLI